LSLLLLRPPTSTLLPYTTLFRSDQGRRHRLGLGFEPCHHRIARRYNRLRRCGRRRHTVLVPPSGIVRRVNCVSRAHGREEKSKSPSQPAVYIVDDDDGMRRALTLLIGTVGYHAVPFARPREFLEKYD